MGCGLKINYSELICNDCFKSFKQVVNTCKSCGSSLNIDASICHNCIKSLEYDFIYSLFWYKGIVRDLFREVKFKYSLKGIKVFQSLVNNIEKSFNDYDIITTVPSFLTRKLRRFIHPADLIARTLSAQNGIELRKTLQRVRRTEFQWKMRRRDRFLNVKGAFSSIYDVSGLRILLIDDIITTGATLNECAHVLKKSGAVKVDCFVFARGVFL